VGVIIRGKKTFLESFLPPLTPIFQKSSKIGVWFYFKFNYSAFAKQTYRAEGISSCFSNISTIPTGIDIDFFVSVDFRFDENLFYYIREHQALPYR
jgi:hypothetical protein